MIRVLLLLGLVTGEALAQVASATLSGIVLDESADAVIPGLYKSVGAQDENDLRLERAVSSFNVGRRISGGYVVSLPTVRSFGLMMRNWRFTGTVTQQDSMPANVFYYAFDPANTGLPNRPNIVPGVSLTLPRGQRTPEEFFNLAAFMCRCPTLHFGTAGRNIVMAPAITSSTWLCVAGLRSASVARWSFARTFNIFNHPSWGVPGAYGDFTAPLFGGILGVEDPRRFQYAILYDF